MAYQLNEEDRRIAQMMASSSVPAITQPTVVQPQKKKKGFLLDNLSTGGSIGGALGGAAAGTAILPGVGTILGALLGGALGGGGGQVVENSIAGDDLGKDVMSEALWGGATALPFGSVGKLAKAGTTLAKGAGSATARTAAKDLVMDAAVKAMPKSTVQKLTISEALNAVPAQEAIQRLGAAPAMGGKLASKLTGAADDLAVKQFRLTPTQLSSFKQKFGEDAGQVIRKYGFNSAEDIAQKGINPLQDQFSALVKNAGEVSADTVKSNFDTAISKLKGAKSSTNRAIGEQLQNEVDSLMSQFGKTINADELNLIRREFDSLVNYTNKVADPNKYGVNKRVADVLRRTLQEADPTGQLKNVGQELSKLRQLSENVAKQGELGRGSLPLGITNLLGATSGAGLGGLPGMAAGLVGVNAINSPVGRKAISGTLDAVAKSAGKIGNKEGGQSAIQALARMGIPGVMRNGLESQSPSDLNSMAVNAPITNTTNIPSASNIGGLYQNPPEMSIEEPSIGGITKSQLETMMTMAMMDGNEDAFGQMQALYEMLPQPNAEKELTQGQQERQDLINMIGMTQNLVDQGSINYGPIGSKLEGLKSLFNAADEETLAFKNTVSGLRGAITKARAGASLTDGELALLNRYTPSETDSEQVVRSKLAALQQLYGSSAPQSGIVGALQSL